MPTVLRSGPYRLFFYSGDRAEPPHVHVERGDMIAKIWLGPPRLESSGGLPATEIRRLLRLIEENADFLQRSWDEFFAG